MRNKDKIILNGLRLVIVLLIASFTSCGAVKDAEQVKKEFSCWVTAENGNTVNGYCADDGKWYIFLPSTFHLREAELSFSGEVKAVDSGILDIDRNIVSSPFTKSGDSVRLTEINGDIYTVTVLQSDLPSVQIYLSDKTLDEIHSDKTIRDYHSTIHISDFDTPQNNLVLSDCVQLKGRGNSSWMLYDKKGYQLTFPDKESVLGMKESEKWILLANSSDDSMLRNKLGFTLASKIGMPFTPSFEYIDLWIDGEYLGTYLLGEKITIEPSRLNLVNRDAALFEHDEAFWREEEFSFYNNYVQGHFTLKESLSDKYELVQYLAQDFNNSVNELMKYLFSTPSSTITLDSLSQYIDVGSFARYFLVNEYLLNRESYSTSFYWYKDGSQDVIHLGPVWDFDTSMGNDGADRSRNHGNSYMLFRYLLNIPAFQEYLQELYITYKDEFLSLSSIAGKLAEKINISAEMNYIRWDMLGKISKKNYSLKQAESFSEAVENLKEWLDRRSKGFVIPQNKTITSVMSEDCSKLEIYLEDTQEYDDVAFAVIMEDSESLTANWYSAYKVENYWKVTADLSIFRSAGIYRIDAYTSSQADAVAIGKNYAPTPADTPYVFNVELLPDNNLHFSLVEKEKCPDVVFTIKNIDDPESTDKHLQGVRNIMGVWEHTVNMSDIGRTGTYQLNAYRNDGGNFTMIGTDSIKYFNEDDFTLNVALSDDKSIVNIDIVTQRKIPGVSFAVWSNENGQDDLCWFDAVYDSVGTFSYAVDMSLYNSTGKYSIHAYEKSAAGISTLLGTSEIDISQ